MRPVKQEHYYGCGVACIAFVTKKIYQDVINSIESGENKAENKGFFCGELVVFLNNNGFYYYWKYINKKIRSKIYQQGVVVFVKRSKRYPFGHYLARSENKWMDPWVNFPVANIKGGFRKRLPGKPIYAILPEY